MNETATSPPESAPPDEPTRPLYVRRIPEPLWLRLHENALRSRVRLQTYVVKLLEAATGAGELDRTETPDAHAKT